MKFDQLNAEWKALYKAVRVSRYVSVFKRLFYPTFQMQYTRVLESCIRLGHSVFSLCYYSYSYLADAFIQNDFQLRGQL